MTILGNEKLIRDDCNNWKCNMNLVLVIENIQYMLKEECPPISPKNAPQSISYAYNKWIESNDKSYNCLLESIIGMIKIHHEEIEIA